MRILLLVAIVFAASGVSAQSLQTVYVPTRPGVTQRIMVFTPDKVKAEVVLFAGGDGGIGIDSEVKLPVAAISW